ncbi:ADP-ribose diphosphatase [Luteimicrobium xylanilyticum]|uniref:ADP-ribose diphosphatase n=1 Tax=Luteimicrobium xylanilyticum TaxID=1133546 RepID=A0A5P9QC94_9MICO|nr:NUDIX hydrolase [Luteimicrobium xylanilyticum]QFU98075.1 ADP-ribose diphosphatase [Luteimicrobium xylanilyticum]
MSTPREAAGHEPVVRDVVAPRPVVRRELVHHGRIWDVVADDVDLGGGTVVSREIVDHPGAVAVVALDDDGRVLLLRQYRHPVRRELWEVPAGLLDVAGEPADVAAARELGEEADLRAARWDVLVDYYTSPGGSSEALRVFLARDLSAVPDAERHVREDEERDIELRWVALDDAVDAVLGGAVHNPSAVVGVLAAHAARAAGWSTLRPADSPWPERRTATMTERAATDVRGAGAADQG